MRLLALYIKHYRDLFHDICFNFTSDYTVSYDDNTLIINHKEYPLKDFYGKRISDISVIIGENGSGKSSILNIIGSIMEERLRTLEYKNGGFTDRYFLVYYVKSNMYYLEFIGNDFEFKNFDLPSTNYLVFSTYIINDNGSFQIQKNPEQELYGFVDNKNELNTRILFINSYSKSLAKSNIQPLSGSNKWRVERNHVTKIDWLKWYKSYLYLYDAQIIQSNRIALKFNQSSNGAGRRISFLLNSENKDEDITEYFGNIKYMKESFRDFVAHNIFLTITFILDSVVKNLVNDENNSFYFHFNKIQEKWKFSFSLNKISELFNDISDLINSIYDISISSEISYYNKTIQLYKNLYLSISKLKDYIKPGVDDFELILDGECDDNLVFDFLESIDTIKEFFYANKYDQCLPIIDVTNNEIIPLVSQGENNVILMFCLLTQEINSNVKLLSIGESIDLLFLIDEVESCMHIEWSRNYIAAMVKLIQDYNDKLDWYKDRFNIQFIMTTHSPFLVSDLLNKSIIELEINDDDHSVSIKPHDRMFAQNIQRIISNDFFMKHFCGEYAVEQLNDIINVIKSADELSDLEKERIKQLINEVGEPILRNKLLQMYNNHKNRK